MAENADGLLRSFESGELAPEEFRHREHLEVAYRMLLQTPFLEAADRYVRAIRQLAQRAGVPEKFNMTITLAFLSLVAERMSVEEQANEFAGFLGRNMDLMSPRVLEHLYSPQRLACSKAREMFLMPDRI